MKRRILVAFSAAALSFVCVGNAGAEHLCFVPSGQDYIRAFDCTVPPSAWPIHWAGFATNIAEACGTEQQCGFRDDVYVWAISASTEFPWSNIAALPPGESSLYLWYYCSVTMGVSTAEFGLGGTLPVISFTPYNGFTNTGTATDLRLSVRGCPTGPMVAGVIRVYVGATAAQEGEGPSTWGRAKALYR